MVRHRSYRNTPGESELSRFMARSMEEMQGEILFMVRNYLLTILEICEAA